MFGMLKGLKKKKISFKLKYKFKIDKRLRKTLVLLGLALAFGLLLYRTKHLFVSALVNGRPITRASLDRQLEKQFGRETLENLITQTLILQEAKKQKIKVTPQEINDEIGQIEEELKSQGANLETFLEFQGLTRESLEEQVEIQLILEKILGSQVEVTDEEVEAYFEENKDFLGEDVTLDGMRGEIETRLRQTKMGEKFQEWLENLKKDSRIYYFFKV